MAARSAGTSSTQNQMASRSLRGVAFQSAVVICRSMWQPVAHASRCPVASGCGLPVGARAFTLISARCTELERSSCRATPSKNGCETSATYPGSSARSAYAISLAVKRSLQVLCSHTIAHVSAGCGGSVHAWMVQRRKRGEQAGVKRHQVARASASSRGESTSGCRMYPCDSNASHCEADST